MLDIINSFFGQHQQLCKLMSILHQVLYFIYFQSANYFQSTTQLICCSTLVITVTCLVTLVITKTFPVRLQSQNSRQTPTASKTLFLQKDSFPLLFAQTPLQKQKENLLKIYAPRLLENNFFLDFSRNFSFMGKN